MTTFIVMNKGGDQLWFKHEERDDSVHVSRNAEEWHRCRKVGATRYRIFAGREVLHVMFGDPEGDFLTVPKERFITEADAWFGRYLEGKKS